MLKFYDFIAELAKKPCAEVFGRDELSSSSVSPWARTPSTVALSRRRDFQPFGITDSANLISRRKYSEPIYRSKSLSRVKSTLF